MFFSRKMAGTSPAANRRHRTGWGLAVRNRGKGGVSMEQNFGNQGARDPEDRRIDENSEEEKKDKMMDKTIADTFPASDPPSSIPDPDDDSFRDDKIDDKDD
jgi:hypothetical protein